MKNTPFLIFTVIKIAFVYVAECAEFPKEKLQVSLESLYATKNESLYIVLSIKNISDNSVRVAYESIYDTVTSTNLVADDGKIYGNYSTQGPSPEWRLNDITIAIPPKRSFLISFPFSQTALLDKHNIDEIVTIDSDVIQSKGYKIHVVRKNGEDDFKFKLIENSKEKK
jgi:hypothetical protein